jgi:hypothetical protein
MKTLFSILLMWPMIASAQLNLDKRLDDSVYESFSGDGTYYFIPRSLCRLSPPEYTLQGVRLVADFMVGICPSEIARAQKILSSHGVDKSKLKIIRGFNASVETSSLRQIYPDYDIHLQVLGDPGLFSGAIAYRISVDAGYKRRSNRWARQVLDQIFDPNSMDAYFSITYVFPSLRSGELRDSQTTVAAMIQEKGE